MVKTLTSLGILFSTFSVYAFSTNTAPKLSPGAPFDKVVSEQLDGLDNDLQKEKILGFIKALPAAKSQVQAASNVNAACLKEDYIKICGDVFAKSERESSNKSRAILPHLKLTKADLPKWNQLDLQQATRAISKHNINNRYQFATMLAEEKSCQSTALYTALGASLEDKFPDPKNVETTLAMYKKSSDCGTDESAMRARYRLGLMQLWQGNCVDGTKTLKAMPSENKIAWIDSRSRYWSETCVLPEEHRMPASAETKPATDKVAESFSLYPMSFHAIVFSLENDDDLLKRVLAQKEPSIFFRSENQTTNLIVALTEASLRTNQSEYAKFFMGLIPPNKTTEEEVGFRLYSGYLYHRTELPLSKFQLFSDVFSQNIGHKTVTSLKMMYPLWKYDIVDEATKELDPLLILSLIRQESAFQENARSHAGARGLMQLMPGTANALNGKKLKPNQLYDAGLNVKLGTKFVDRLLERYDGNVYKVLAAYNAGPLRVDEWTRRYPTDNNMMFMDLIPYKETRDYVAAILRNYYWYSKLYPELSKKQVAFWQKPEKLATDTIKLTTE